MLTEHDKKVYAILLAMEIEAFSDRINPGEKEFIVSPSYCASMMQTTTGKQMVDHKHYGTKKPFDWMSEDQFANLQVFKLIGFSQIFI
jgi:dynein heavy chain, axonemal